MSAPLKKQLHMPYIVSMLKCENRLYCAGKRPPSPPYYSFLSCALPLLLVGNHITTPCFFHSLRGRDGAMEPMQQHPMQLGCNLSPILLSSSSRFLSCPCLHQALTPKSMPYSATIPKLGSVDLSGSVVEPL